MAAYVAILVSTHFVPGLPRENAARPWELPADDRGDATVVSLRGQANFRCASLPQACLSCFRWRPAVVDGVAAIRCR
jgi:hypothetical protein